MSDWLLVWLVVRAFRAVKTASTLRALVHLLCNPETLRLLEDSLDQHRAFKEMVEAAEAEVK